MRKPSFPAERKDFTSESGFTLIEIVISLFFFGIIAMIAGMWMVVGLEGYVLTRDNVNISQKAGLAMARIGKELTGLSEIEPTGSSNVCIRYKVAELPDYYRALVLEGSNIMLKASASSDCDCNTDVNTILIDHVSAFDVSYDELAGGSITTHSGGGMTLPSDLTERLIGISITLTISSNSERADQQFELSVSPRNNQIMNAPGAG